MITNRQFAISGLLGLILLGFPFFKSVVPKMVEKAEIEEIQKRKTIPYEKPDETEGVQLTTDKQFFVTNDTVIYFRDNDFSHKIIEMGFGQNYQKIYDLSNKDEITFALLDKETRITLYQDHPLSRKSLVEIYQPILSDKEQEYYAGILYNAIKAGHTRFEAASGEETILELKTKTPKDRRGRAIRNDQGRIITVLDTPKVVRFANNPLDITRQ